MVCLLLRQWEDWWKVWEEKVAGHRQWARGVKLAGVMNRLDPIEELYDMYSEEEDTLRIVELKDDGLDFVLDVEGPANPYMDL